ncbi:MerC domain-containing protein [Gilvimarinus agarilyticus]|uniref:MerC domain-containing protein n=1 Tax=Gilvimarinus sp. 2_MG-2023 TaxID=3062666 RepID=UPI001C092682|nr:MerC domain-containing protein [Gilvimarinus sp. 2_MG-2023]MBU2884358.1 MerC domain-containing protein [Gilvimarinus agarilyticus]MDO6569494.1 MerC domain-containing protein [Gilvimarinus sp. 2_MG-2023]
MKTAQALTDKLAIGLSLACAIHCLTLPLLLVLLPSLAALQLDHETFHVWMVAAVIPSSLFALTLGCKQHRRIHVLLLGTLGLVLLVMAVALGAARIGEAGEKALTLAGAVCVALGHAMNFRLCRVHKEKACPCPSQKQAEVS